MLFGMLIGTRPRKHVLDGVHVGTTWQIRLNRGCDTTLCQITLMTCYYFTQSIKQCLHCNVHFRPSPDSRQSTADDCLQQGWRSPAGNVHTVLRRTSAHTSIWTAKDRRRTFHRWRKGWTDTRSRHHRTRDLTSQVDKCVPHTVRRWNPTVNKHT